ncbi:hypothetical protein LC087_06565 [Bacillus carboniphilus]|uniref:Uncharacterized protein n=1 Tax=Bacillus carboniphilus TaxID=86663 RepID=A0ABY9JZA7_9BACI|nr:hypothetical protein [Bacillus carboniphilus]WLR43785.1 hypothetical protein LC087_06565 [Bacillus carboniphilus]
MLIKEVTGEELQKSQKNSPEDSFSRSIVHYIWNDKELSLSVLYVRYFEEKLLEFIHFSYPELKDINPPSMISITFLLTDPHCLNKHRLYISTLEELIEPYLKLNSEQIRQLKDGLMSRQPFLLDVSWSKQPYS